MTTASSEFQDILVALVFDLLKTHMVDADSFRP